MVLTAKQEQGLKIVVDRYKNNNRYAVISGYAGSGKSTLVRFIIEALNLKESDVCYATYTGKAAEVLRKKGNKNSMTLHKMLYNFEKDGNLYIRTLKKDINYKFIVVDECSMVPNEIIKDLASLNIFILFLGDPFQIPPINPSEENHLLDKPHIFLDEIMRQAKESEIIRVSMDIREGRPLKRFVGKEVQVLEAKELNTGMLTWADQVLCATNKKRCEINDATRRILGRNEVPQNGDKVVCLRNEWDIINNYGDPLVNGTIGYLDNTYNSYVNLPYWIEGGRSIKITKANLVMDDKSYYKGLQMDTKMILTGDKCMSEETESILLKNHKTKYIHPLEFTYGYAITSHKAQGSQWDKVLVIEEYFPFERVEHARHLYTGLTRAIKKCVIIKK